MRHVTWLALTPLLFACGTLTLAPPVLSGVATAHPPADPGGPPPDAASAANVSVFAIRTLWFGDIVPGTNSSDGYAWQSLGFDIDGKDTAKDSADVCTLTPGAGLETQADGQGGIDNSFGANILPILITLFGSNLTTELNASLSAGQVTDLIVVKGLGAGPTASPLSASLVVAAPLGGTPTWTSADTWPVDSSSLKDSDPSSPLLAFAQSYEVGGVFVGEPPSDSGEIALGMVNGTPFVLPIRHVQVAMTPAEHGSVAMSGTISGIIPTDRLLPLVPPIAIALANATCTSDGIPSVQEQFQQAQDVMLDGTNQAGEACNGISVGLGFDAVLVQMGAVAEVAPLVDPCPAGDGGP
jgi:hypothetical protein